MLPTVVLVAVTLLLLYGPGLAIGALLGLRGLVTIAVAPAITFGVIGSATPVLGVLDIPWNPLTAGVVLLIAAGLSWVVMRVMRPLAARWLPAPAHDGSSEDRPAPDGSVPATPRRDIRQVLLVVAGIAVGVVIGAVELMRGMGPDGLDATHQGWDTAWHANYTQWITDTGEASPLRAGVFQNWSSHAPAYYPSSIHAFGSLVQHATGQGTPRLINLYLVLVSAVLIPLGAAALTWFASRRNATATAIAGALAASFSIFPVDQVWRPAVPFAIGLALLGPVLVVVFTAVTKHRELLPAGALSIVGIASVHTSVAFCVAYFALCWLVVRLLRPRREAIREIAAFAVMAVLAAVALAPQLKGILSQAGRVATFDWSQGIGTVDAVRQVFGFGFGESQLSHFGGADVRTPQYLLGALAAVAAVLALRHRRTAWLSVGYLLFALITVHASVPRWSVVGLLSAPWYNDPWRTAAIACVLAVPLVAIGIVEVCRLIRLPERSRPFVAVAAVAAVFLTTGFGYVERNAERVAWGYRPGVLDAGEVDAMRQLGELTGGRGRVLNDPYDGSVWLYSVAHQPTVFTHYDVGILSEDQWFMVNLLNQWDVNPDVRAAARRLGVKYLYLASGQIYENLPRPKGYAGIEDVPGVRVVIDTGTAKVYELPGA